MGKVIIELINGEKFAFLLISGGTLDRDLPDIYQLEPDLWIMNKFPLDMDKNWKDWLGEFMINEIQEASLCIYTKCRSASIDSLDIENEKLKNKLRYFLSGITLSGFCQFNNNHLILTGSMIEDKANVRSVDQENHSIYQAGAPYENITIERLNKSLKIAEALDKLCDLRSIGNYQRIVRSLHAYYSAIFDKDIGVRLHEFVRCVEGLIIPEKSKTRKQFISRTELFLGKRFHDFSGEIYDLRCEIEHLHGPYSLEVGAPSRGYRLHAWQRVLESEAFARYCMSNFLLNEKLWPYFESDEKLKLFWKMLEQTKSEIWGAPFDLNQVATTFRLDVVEDSMLLLKNTKS